VNGSTRFIIISVLTGETARRFDDARRQTCLIGSSQAALAYPPHLTLRTGVLLPDSMIDGFLEEFSAVVGLWTAFPVNTEGTFVSRYRDGALLKNLVGYKVRKDPPLAELNRRLLGYEKWRASDRLHFEPHLTLAFDDLTDDGVRAIQQWWEKEPEVLPDGLQWSCDNIGLYRREQDAWIVFREWRAA